MDASDVKIKTLILSKLVLKCLFFVILMNGGRQSPFEKYS